MKVGILGAGQLGRMLAGAALKLGLEPHLYDPDPSACGHSAGSSWPFAYEHAEKLERFARPLEVCTYEFENVPVAVARQVAEWTRLCPGAAALEVSQDRLSEKSFLRSLGLDLPAFRAYEPGSLLPGRGILKTRRLGYDGKGQVDLTGLSNPWEKLGQQPAIWEEKLNFQRELSQLGVRSLNGEIQFYPLVETIQSEGILSAVVAPARNLAVGLESRAQAWLGRILSELDYVGVLALELFEVDGQLLANEIAPRVHNSGHWTDHGCTTSQFENHWRAVLGWPLGDVQPLGSCRLVNPLGELPAPATPRAGVFANFYGKEPRAGRKLGHLTLVAASDQEVDQLAHQPWKSGVVIHGS